MNVMRKILLSFLGGLLGTVLIGVAWTNIGTATIRNRSVVYGWLNKSNFYSQVADIATQNIEKESQNSGQNSLPLSDPAVKNIVKNALSSDFIMTSTKTVVDSIYQWLDGTSQDLTFTLDLSPIKNQVVDGLTAYAKTRSAGLPKCGAVDGNGPVDPLTATCLPKGMTAVQLTSLAHDYVVGQKLFQKPVIEGSSIMVTENGQSVPLTSSSKVAAARKAYMLSGYLPLGLGIATVLLILAIVFLSRRKLQGLSRVGTIFIVTGVGLLIIYAGLRYFFDWGSKHLANVQGGLNTQQKLGIDLTRVVLSDVERVLLIFVILYICVGVVAHIAKIILEKRHKTAKYPESHDENMPTEANPSPAPRDLTPITPRPFVPSAPVLPKKPRPPRKIQL